MLPQPEAIVVRDARKCLGDGSIIFDGLNMTVRRGTIYGLLGASGCGKTTLLSCIVGIRKLDRGEVWVLGGHPGSKTSSIPGPQVGYMPQEISLVHEFTGIGALYYFGRINGLEDDAIESRYAFLSDLLQLPPRNRLIKHMSGGQQRRVSFACALIHEPELLILDEPTVGLDPLLRENIWNFLVNLARSSGTTIIITTHYIEEAKEADKIGLLRCGRLLAEASPTKLLANCNCNSLEEAFLLLSQKQNDAQVYRQSNIVDTELQEMRTNETLDQNRNFSPKEYHRVSKISSQISNPRRRNRKFQALMIKNCLQFLRHPGGILFAFIFPLIQVNVFFNAIGQDPKDLLMAVVNDEAGDCAGGKYLGTVVYDEEEDMCDYVDLSCRFISGFQEAIGRSRFYKDHQDARDAVKFGQAVGLVHFDRNFSKSLQARRDRLELESNTSGRIEVSLDMGDRQIGLHMEKTLFSKFFEIYEMIVSECRIPKRFVDIPLKFEDPVFGAMNQKFSDFMAPTFLLTVTFFLSTAVSSSVIISDRHEGIWNRSLVQGVTTPEILTAHLITQLIIIIIQVSVTMVISFMQYNLKCSGSVVTVIAMILLMGICGMCYGFLVSVLCTSHTMANYITTGSFYPVILLCGCVWPVEGMPTFLRWLSLALPTTVPGISLRNILDKGYRFDDVQVYQGFLVIFGWTILLVLLCFLGLRSNKF
ncbi:ABC transporter G family member 20 [Fopius arisanus]|uniref:ABC transporter G family member 20 n=1 Tax=Fopius arisanus TaxID=64838 RepID=A0A0C9R7B6_9HYME|nr:PREDICTED: ABC transporter G family member 20 [Fopius arisanus]XP_011307564.1 PREDICTED: ABC transporter G family member 20 [Fopius arisanus]XP_011307642.1 PREDICTED: ABC transporter G family member 20 [Fopius arisanus]